jgi:hypothetical protein
LGWLPKKSLQSIQTLWYATKMARSYSLRYDAVNAMLLNEFLKEHRKVEELEGTVSALAATPERGRGRPSRGW